MKKVELLAPAGDLERLKIALLYGADAVYVGGELFSLRANTPNFTLEELKEGVEFAHKLNKKVYVTVNIVMHNKELKHIENYLKELEKINVDAIIASDPAIINIALKKTKLHVHLSTQASTINKEAAEFWKNEGIERIVLARETSKEDIEDIINNVEIELECFIHGAMCSSYSGRCVLSNFLTNRDANRGGCSQICRWDFNLLNNKKEPIKGNKPFTFCTKDLSMLKYIPDMIEQNIASFKIEGRMRSLYYVATITDIYRKAIDEYYNNKEKFEYNKEYEKILSNCANRDSVPQFYNNKYDNTCSYYNGRCEISNQDFLGIIIEYKDGCMIIEQRNYFKIGDTIEIFGPKKQPFKVKITEMYDEENNQLEVARHPKQIIKIPNSKKVEKWDLIRIKK
ncbi:MAG: U32 family peptidase [Bacilli bacterium]|nr:U32 family peptidase [Bacilli bacterium]MBP3921318.1 U32 family peptidase [Bacilli bacterium]